MNSALILILSSVLFSAAGQLFLKQGVINFGPLDLSVEHIFFTMWRVFTNLYVVIGLIFYVGSTFLWIIALSMVELSYCVSFYQPKLYPDPFCIMEAF